MEKTIKITYTEQAKAVVCTTQIGYTGEGVPSNDDVLKEAQDLYDKASLYSVRKSMQK
jgi:hypothetical protein